MRRQQTIISETVLRSKSLTVRNKHFELPVQVGFITVVSVSKSLTNFMKITNIFFLETVDILPVQTLLDQQRVELLQPLLCLEQSDIDDQRLVTTSNNINFTR